MYYIVYLFINIFALQTTVHKTVLNKIGYEKSYKC